MSEINFTKVNSPGDFLSIIPRDIVENIKFRQKLHSLLTDSKDLQKIYLELCLLEPQIIYDSAFFTFDPRQPVGLRNRPFILRPKQRVLVKELKEAIENKHDLAVDKSREEGATEIICKFFAFYWLLMPESSFLVGSRKEELVDGSVDYKGGRLIGAHQSLFHKILYGIVNLPVWMIPKFNKKHLFLQNLNNNSMIMGESTNESFGAGNRATAILVDEIARVEPDVAQYIIDNISDTSPCCVFNSTHFRWGAGHAYARLLRSNKIKVIILGYEDNPEKQQGAYYSPEKDIVEILDIEYYHQQWPEIFKYAEN